MVKKFISFISAVAVAVSAFAGLGVTANAAVGDVLYSQDFSANNEPWGAPVEVGRNIVGTDYVAATELAGAPASVTDTVFNFKTDEGNNGYTGTVAFEESVVADAYEISFDTYVKNAAVGAHGYVNNVDMDLSHFTYKYGIGDGTADGMAFGFSVTGSDISVISGGNDIDTGIDTGDEGVWVNVNVTVNVPTHKMSGTITPQSGTPYTFSNISTSGANTDAISGLYIASVRYSSSSKGYVNNYIDNVEVSEAQAQEAGNYSYEIIAKTASGQEIAVLESGYVTEGTVISYTANNAIVADGKGYVLTDGAALSFSVDENITEYVTYKEADGAAASYGFTSATDPRPVAQQGGTVAYVTDEEIGTALAYTSTGAKSNSLRYIYYSLADFISADYESTYIGFDSKISNTVGRIEICLRDATLPEIYSDTGYFWAGTSKSGGYRVNETQKAGGDVWVHTNFKWNAKTNELEYLLTNFETGAIIDSGIMTLSGTPAYLGFLSHGETTAYLANLTVVQDGYGDTSDARFDFEDEDTAFKANGHAAVSIVDAPTEISDSTNDTNVLKFASDSETGESKPAYASIDISKYTFGAKKVKIEYDTYVDTANVIFGVTEALPSSYSETNDVFSHGYRSNKGYYVIYGESGSAYTALNGQWVHASVEYDAEADKVTYTVKGADGTSKSGTKSELGINALNYVYIFSGAASSAAYIDNVAVYTERDYIDLYSANVNGHAELVDMGEYVAFTSDSATGGSTPATGSYDISALTEGKSNVLVSYDSFVYSGSRSTFGVDDVFSQGWGAKDYYIINGESGSGYTFAADTWVNTKIAFDLNEGTYTYTVTSLEGDDTYTGKGTLSAKEINAIVWKSTTTDDEAYINNISVYAYGELALTEYTVYEAVYMEDGTLDYVVITTTTNPKSYEPTEGGRVFIWDGDMKPYK